jgi:hypothetical protein
MTMRQVTLSLVAIISVAVLGPAVKAQSPTDSKAPSSAAVLPASTEGRESDLRYTRPTQRMRFHSYFFDAFGPYPMVGAAVAAGINQAYSTPPEWKQGAEGYGKRIGSNFAIAAVTTTTRYAMSEAFREDTMYYRCECKGLFPRLGHALISTFTARRGDDGHRVFSFPALVSPYAGTMTAVYAWYPGRYDAKDGFRMGNYSLLGYAGANVAMEFL